MLSSHKDVPQISAERIDSCIHPVPGVYNYGYVPLSHLGKMQNLKQTLNKPAIAARSGPGVVGWWRWCWVNFQCRGVLLIWIVVGQGPTALAVGVGGGCLDIFSLVYHFFLPPPSLWETARYRLKYCLKGPLSPKATNQQTNKPTNGLVHFGNYALFRYDAVIRTVSVHSGKCTTK